MNLLLKTVFVTMTAMPALTLLQGCSPAEEPAPPPAASAPAPAAAPAKPAPVAEPASDALALSEEELDRIEAEKAELASRAGDLEEQVQDGKALIAMKEKQIRELEAQLKKSASPAASPAP